MTTGTDSAGAIPRAFPPRMGTSTSVPLALVGPLIIVALCWLRSPQMLLEGRFWAEDAMFYGYATHSATFLQKAAYVYKGHLELFTSFTHALASYLNPKMAPLFTASAALLLECCLGYLIVALRKELSIGLAPALAICALVVVSPVASEHYLNIVNSQWVAAAILVVLINVSRDGLRGHEILVGLSSLLLGLCGVESCLMFPVALLYAAAWRSRPHVIIAGSLLACCLVQGGLVVTHPIESRLQPMAATGYIVAPFLQIVVKHLLGMAAEIHLAEWYRQGPMATGAPTSFLILPLAALAGLVGLVGKGGRPDRRLLLASILLLLGLNEVGAVGDRNDMVGPIMMRYFFVPGVMVALLLAKSEPAPHSLPLRHAALGVALLVSATDFFADGYNDSLVTMQHAWRRDVDGCRSRLGPCHIAISPDGFEVVMPSGR